MAKSINIYKSISDYNDGYDERKNISISLIIDDEEEEIVDSHVKSGFITFTAEEAGSTIGLAKLSSYQLLEYTTDQVINPSAMCYPVWKKMDVDTIITLANAGDMVHFRGVLSGHNNSSNYTQFKMTGKISSSGNCNSLWNYSDLTAPLKEYCGYNMFRDCKSLTTAPELPATTLADSCYRIMFRDCKSLTTAPELPATTLAYDCYSNMFAGCTSLTTAPDLPATTLVIGCYEYMFHSCTRLTTAPELPATTLANWCYNSMFTSCKSLTTAPVLPATTLANYCYSNMFQLCSSLTTAPELPATTLADNCYNNMFYGCSNLNYIKCLATDRSATNCTMDWVYGVSATGTFVKAADVSWTTGIGGIPSGWIIKETGYATFTAEQENSTIGLSQLSSYQTLEYKTDSSDWTNIDTSTTITLNNIGDKVYIRGELSNNNTSSNYTQFTMTGKIAASGNCNALWSCNDLNAPLKEYCGCNMFLDCTSLTTAPELPATTLAERCYDSMFKGCSSLNYIKCLATDISAYNCTTNWISGVSSTGTFIKEEGVEWTTGTDGIPEGWIIKESGYATFTAEQENSTIGLYKLSSYQTLEYKTDSSDWKNMDISTIITLNSVGDKVYIRGELSNNNTSSNYTQFKMTGKIAASGNCNALWSCNDLNAHLKAYCGRSMFNGCSSLTTAPELQATTLAERCYEYMFQGCTGLTQSPELQATTLSGGCYYSMFQDCISLTTAPSILPATTLAERCYCGMFEGCTSLTTAPELPATTLASYCYSDMFRGCTSLTTAPELPATTLESYCYIYMFYGCTSLTTAPELPATTLADHCYFYMFLDCTSLTTAPSILPATTLVYDCYCGMFEGCTSLTTAPELPATTLVMSCYEYMFSGCSNLNYIKCLATDISAYYCTNNWVDGVSSSGIFVKAEGVSWSRGVDGFPSGWASCTEQMLNIDINNFVTFTAEQKYSTIGLYNYNLSPNHILKYRTDSDSDWKIIIPSNTITLNNIGDKVYIGGYLSNDNSLDYTQFKMTGKIAASGNCNALWSCNDLNAPLKSRCGYRMFQDCTSLTTAPELPATTLASNCYGYMFSGCTGLTTAPDLPATKLVKYCYEYMFRSCTSLTIAPDLPATTLASRCYGYMFSGCAGLTTAPDLPATKLENYCYQYMFYGCSNLNYIKCLATNISAASCTYDWVEGVASTGTFVKASGISWSTGTSGIPSGWTVEEYNPEQQPEQQ